MRQLDGKISELTLRKHFGWTLGLKRYDYYWVLANEHSPKVTCRLRTWFRKPSVQNGDMVRLAGEWNDRLLEVYALEDVETHTRQVFWNMPLILSSVLFVVMVILQNVSVAPRPRAWLISQVFVLISVVTVSTMAYKRYQAARLLGRPHDD